MKGCLGSVARELHQHIGDCQRRDIGCCCHPDQATDVDKGAKQNIWAATSPGGQPASCSIAEHAKEWVSEKRDESSRHQHKGQCLALMQSTDKFENLARKNDNTDSTPVKVK